MMYLSNKYKMLIAKYQSNRNITILLMIVGIILLPILKFKEYLSFNFVILFQQSLFIILMFLNILPIWIGLFFSTILIGLWYTFIILHINNIEKNKTKLRSLQNETRSTTFTK